MVESSDRYDDGLAKNPPDPFAKLNKRQFDDPLSEDIDSKPAYYRKTDKSSLRRQYRDEIGKRDEDQARQAGATEEEIAHMHDKVPVDLRDPERRERGERKAQVQSVKKTMRTANKLGSLAKLAKGSSRRRY